MSPDENPAILLNPADSVAVALRSLKPGEAADPEATLNTQEKIRVALRNVDRVITDNEVAIKDTLRNFETFTASLSGNGERITSIIR